MLNTMQCTYIWNIIYCFGRILGDLVKQAKCVLVVTEALPLLMDTCNENFLHKNKDLKCINGINLTQLQKTTVETSVCGVAFVGSFSNQGTEYSLSRYNTSDLFQMLTLKLDG